MALHTTNPGDTKRQMNLAPFAQWSATQQYNTDDLVVSSSGVWKALQNNRAQNPDENTFWTKVVGGGGGGVSGACLTVSSTTDNALVICGSTAGNFPSIKSTGVDTDIGINVRPKGGEALNVFTQNWNNLTGSGGFQVQTAGSTYGPIYMVAPASDTLGGAVIQGTFNKGLEAAEGVGGFTNIANMNATTSDGPATGEIAHYLTALDFSGDKAFLNGTLLGIDNDFRHALDDQWMLRVVEGHGQFLGGFPDSQALVGINTIGLPAAVLHVVNPIVVSTPLTSTYVVLAVEGVATQTASLQTWKLTGGSVLLSVTSTGGVLAPNLATSNPAVLGALYRGAGNAVLWSTGP